jgi:AcrR family transcriptional regulator
MLVVPININEGDHKMRENLTHVAAGLFAEKGYQGVGLRELATVLGVNAGSLYYHIESKQALLFEIMESALADLIMFTRRRLKYRGAAIDRLRVFVSAYLKFRAAEFHRIKILMHEQAHLTSDQLRRIDDLKSEYSSILLEIIEVRNGAKPSNHENNMMTAAILGMLHGYTQWSPTTPPDPQLEAQMLAYATGIIRAECSRSAAA